MRCMCYGRSEGLGNLCPLCESKMYEPGSSPRRRLEWKAQLAWPFYAVWLFFQR